MDPSLSNDPNPNQGFVGIRFCQVKENLIFNLNPLNIIIACYICYNVISDLNTAYQRKLLG